MILVVNNRDSFVHNLARYVREAGQPTVVMENDHPIEEYFSLQPKGIVLSPGPKAPMDAGMCISLITECPESLPMLGVCLGHQCLAEAFGGQTEKARRPLHGRASLVHHNGSGVFEGIPSPMNAGRYHSLISEVAPGGALDIVAHSEEGEVMGLAHKTRPLFGVQFHPESVLTPYGRRLMSNFVTLCSGEENQR